MGTTSDCNRNGCDNTMSTNHSKDYGYICYQCLKELISTPDVSIRAFMESPAKVYSRDGSWEEYIEKVFKSIYD